VKKQLATGVMMFLALLTTVQAAYDGWQHSGSFCILTTPEGANLPATAVEEEFPLLVRLNKEWFDFSQVKANGEDIRFAAENKPLAYQIDEWDAAGGTAAIWVRIPVIKGNARQEIKMFWGKSDAVSESNGKAVFNESNGCVSVWHMNEPVNDEVGKVESKDTGTISSAGMIGKARHFDEKSAIDGGTNVTTYPTGNSSNSSEFWVRADTLNEGGLLRWGVCKPHSIIQMLLGRPTCIRLDCFYSAAGIKNESRLPLSQWIHVLYVFKKGDARIYINGSLDGFRTSDSVSLTMGSPAEVKMGGRGFAGDMDEVRISSVARSADWAKLQYDNQKPMQTVVGTLAWPGNEFSVSENKINISEGKSIKVTVKAGGARKLYWIIKKDGVDTIVAVDRLAYELSAGRVVADTSYVLQFMAVYPNEIKTKDIPVVVKEDIPEPVFTLKAPSKWNGRDAIEVVPVVSNLKAMNDKGSGELHYAWTVSGGAVIKEIAPDRLILKRSQYSGPIIVKVAINNGGTECLATKSINIAEPKKDAWIDRVPGKDEKPQDNQFYARDDNDEGTLYYNGTISNAADSVFLKLYANDKLIKTENQKLKTDKAYGFKIKLKAGLVKYRVEFGTKTGGAEAVLNVVTNLVCGDAFIVDGQSNAVAYNYYGVKEHPLLSYASDWIRSYGSGGESGDDTTNGGWGNATITNRSVNGRGGVSFIGCWGMALASNLVTNYKMPICILNTAVGGTMINQHLPDPADHYNTTNGNYKIYRNLLRRVVAARLTHGIRGVLWHQGEADCSNWGPTGDWNYKFYQQNFIDMSAAWKDDMPNLKYYYIFQVFGSGCGTSGTFTSDMLREEQRTLPRLYSGMSIMSTLAFPSGANCHFNIADYTGMGLAMAQLVARDNYGLKPAAAVSAPNLQEARFTGNNRNEIALVFDQPMAWNNSATTNLFLDRLSGKVISGSAKGNVINLQVTGAETSQTIAYVVDQYWHNNTNLIYGVNGIAALTFYGVPIVSGRQK